MFTSSTVKIERQKQKKNKNVQVNGDHRGGGLWYNHLRYSTYCFSGMKKGTDKVIMNTIMLEWIDFQHQIGFCPGCTPWNELKQSINIS